MYVFIMKYTNFVMEKVQYPIFATFRCNDAEDLRTYWNNMESRENFGDTFVYANVHKTFSISIHNHKHTLSPFSKNL